MNTALFCLHGWGGSKESWNELREALAHTSNITLFTPDLPGFGEEPEPQKPWTVDHYAGWCQAWIRTTLEQEKTNGTTYDQVALIGHSHGGRIALKLAWMQSLTPNPSPKVRGEQQTLNYSHLFLCAAAGIRRSRHIKRTIGFLLAKTGKWILSLPGGTYLTPITKKLLYKLMRVHDYERASDVMQKTMINVTQEDLTPLLEEITLPTDLFWGDDDTMTPIEDGILMQEKIPHAVLHRYADCRHAVHREKAQEISATIEQRMHL